ncbi:MAG TPA: hypothetical protein VHC69_30080 [Polyangiaceae bacterium]|nr:hypothetical protein [Polyangiaceae bacterium]
MTYDSDPPRLRSSGPPDDPFVQALEEARLELPSKEQLAAVAARFASAGRGAVPRGSELPFWRTRLRARSVQAGGVALALAMGVSAAVMMRGGFSFTTAPKVKAESPPAATSAVPEKPPRKHAEPPIAPTAEAPREETPPTETNKPRNVVPAPSAHRSRLHALDRPSQGDLPSSDEDTPSAEAEATLLGRAHRALASNPALALSLTNEHRREYPSGALGQERDLIAIEALVGLGRLAEARDRAAAFRARYPSSAHLRRIDRLLGESSGAATPAP